MFTRAVRAASGFTFPYVGLRRRASGEVYSSMGAFILLNSQGWALTAAHLIDEILAVERELAGDVPDGVSRLLSHAEIWATPGFATRPPRLAEMRVRPMSDLALIRLEDVEPASLPEPPVLRDSELHPIEPGMSVCRVGYPFHDVAASWNPGKQEFALAPDAFPVPSFALDGMVARFHRISAKDASGEATFIETSTPGLRGQSGGPLLDVDGNVCGVQSHTIHLDLGFDARFSAGETVVTERQFLNVGAATHVIDVRSLLDEAGLSYRTQPRGHHWSRRSNS